VCRGRVRTAPGDTMPALPHARPPTDSAEARRLRKLAAARHAPASWIQRARIVTGSWDGASVAELAQRLGCHPKTVYKWLHRFNTGGIDGLADLPRPGVPRRISEHQRGRIIAVAPAQPPGRLDQGGEGLQAPAEPEAPATWTLDTLAQAARAEGSRSAAARSAGSCSPNGCAGGGPGRGRPAPTRTSPQKDRGHRPLQRATDRGDGALR
jgi:transposase